MVAAGHPLAAGEGLAVLRSGGNAVDAAIAAAATLSVVSPHECGLGGDLFALIHDASAGLTYGLNASGQSPAAAHPGQFRNGMPATGPMSVCVPGMVGGWHAALARFGTRPLESLLNGAIHYAEEGFAVYERLVENTLERKDCIFADASCQAMFFPEGRAPSPGEKLRQPAAAATLRAIAGDGPDAFYRGPIAKALAAYVTDAGGILTADDLANFQPLWQEPVEVQCFGSVVRTMPPNSWGIAMLLQLAMLEREGIAGDDEVRFALQGIRTRRLAYQQLAGSVADPREVGDEARRRLAGFVTGGVLPQATRFPDPSRMGSDTSQVLVVDNAGNAVSLLQSVFSPFGSGLLVPSLGILCNNRMRGFATDAADPNCVGPGKRPANTLTPALVCKDGAVSLLCATPGGPGQTGTLAQFLARVLARGQSIADAIAASRWSVNLQGEFILEDSTSVAEQRAILAAEPSTKVARHGGVNFGSIAAIVREGDGWLGGVDSRRNAAVVGF
jgi:gamma-glutamyltranspeptidase/glutathione hydrolase